MKNENLKPIIVETKKDNQKFGGHWFRGANCNFIPSKKHFEDNDFYQKYILKGFLPKKPFIEKRVAYPELYKDKNYGGKSKE